MTIKTRSLKVEECLDQRGRWFSGFPRSRLPSVETNRYFRILIFLSLLHFTFHFPSLHHSTPLLCCLLSSAIFSPLLSPLLSSLSPIFFLRTALSQWDSRLVLVRTLVLGSCSQVCRLLFKRSTKI